LVAGRGPGAGGCGLVCSGTAHGRTYIHTCVLTCTGTTAPMHDPQSALRGNPPQSSPPMAAHCPATRHPPQGNLPVATHPRNGNPPAPHGNLPHSAPGFFDSLQSTPRESHHGNPPQGTATRQPTHGQSTQPTPNVNPPTAIHSSAEATCVSSSNAPCGLCRAASATRTLRLETSETTAVAITLPNPMDSNLVVAPCREPCLDCCRAARAARMCTGRDTTQS
jgi:hypothetical protein